MGDKKKNPRRAVIYCRVSKDALGKGLAVERQEKMCRADAKSRKWNVIDVLIEDPISASGYSRKRRPKYEQLLEGIRTGDYDGVIVYALDRITRRVAGLTEFLDVVKADSVPVATISGEFDLTTAQGRAGAYSSAVQSQGEVEAKSERQRAANLQNAEKGRLYGRTMPFGYVRTKKGKIRQDPAVKEHLEHAFEMVQGGASTREVMEYWRDAQLLTQTQRYAVANPKKERKALKETGKSLGKPWTVYSTYQILTNPVYAGVLMYKGAEMPKAKGWEPYLDKPTHELVRAALAARNTNPESEHRKAPKAAFPLSNLLRCSCGEPMTGRTKAGGTRVYVCTGRRSGSCYKEVRSDKAETLVKSYVLGALNGLTPKKLMDTADVKEQQRIAAELKEVTQEQEESESLQGLKPGQKANIFRDLNRREAALRKELEALTAQNSLARVVSYVMTYGSGRNLMKDAARSLTAVAGAFDDLTMTQRRIIIGELGYYKHRTVLRGRSTLEIYPKDPLTGEISMHTIDEDPQGDVIIHA